MSLLRTGMCNIRATENSKKIIRCSKFNRNKKDTIIRFYEKIYWKGDCWIWRNEKSLHFHIDAVVGGTRPARFSYEYFLRKIKKNHYVLPTCGNKYCVQPKHLLSTKITDFRHKYYQEKLGEICLKCNNTYKRTKDNIRYCFTCRIDNTIIWRTNNHQKVLDSYKKYRLKKLTLAGKEPLIRDGKCKKCSTEYTICKDGKYRCVPCRKIRHQGYYLDKKSITIS